jgi:hypothetical protein
MTAQERDELVRDLEHAGCYVRKVEPRPWHDGEWQIVAWCPDPAHFYTITNARLFRQAVRGGLISDLPREALL